ncbi:MAG: HD domain-containing protein [bacterium]
MLPQAAPSSDPSPVVSVIDVGSSGIRMEVARIGADGNVSVLEALTKAVPLGVDVFQRGHLSRQTIEATVDALRGFKQVLAMHDPAKLRAVGTSALRDADNAETLLDRVRHATGIDVEVIDGTEENRLNLLAVQHAARGVLDLAAENAAIIEVGAGSVGITLLDKGRPVSTESQPMGSQRALEANRRLSLGHGRYVANLRRQVRASVRKFERNLPLSTVKLFVALGSDMRFAADRVGQAVSPSVSRIAGEAFKTFCKEIAAKDADRIAADYRIYHGDAERLLPALLTYEQIFSLTGAEALVVPRVTLRDAMILDLAGPAAAGDLRTQVISSAMAIGRKYGTDEAHAASVADIALQLFDALKPLHGLGTEERLYLEVAALLHDAGLFIASRAHHKHSHYIIASSEIFGLAKDELEIVANVARYHRRSVPRKSHPSYMSLGRPERLIVNKLAAVLRLADALDREHSGRVKSIKVVEKMGSVEVWVPLAPLDLTNEQAAFDDKKDLFAEVYGKDVVLRGAAPPA